MANETFKKRLASAEIVLAPGVYDALSALVAEQAGFEALYLSGASIAYTRLGRSDIGLTTFTEVADTLARITERVSAAGDRRCRHRLRQRAQHAAHRARLRARGRGDDPDRGPDFPKRCGHLDGKAVVPAARDGGQAQGRARCARVDRDADPRAHRRGRGRGARSRARPCRGLSGLRRGRTLHRGAAFARADGRRPAAASRIACRCWPTWSKAGRRRSRMPMRCRRTAFASPSFPAAPRARSSTRCRATTRACTGTARRSPGARRCSTSTPERGDRHAGTDGGWASATSSRGAIGAA